MTKDYEDALKQRCNWAEVAWRCVIDTAQVPEGARRIATRLRLLADLDRVPGVPALMR